MINGIGSNCGIITPQIFEAASFGGQPDLALAQIPYFHKMMCQWAYSIAMKFSWVVVINAQSKGNLINKIKSVSSYEPPGWNIDAMADATWTNETQDIVGCIFAQGIRIPGETVNVEHAGLSEGSNRGFINAPIINGRSNFENLEIGFLETNASFVDGVLRPWTIVTAHEGLLARAQNDSIKADIILYQLAKTGEDNPSIIRKIFSFKDCAPINVSNDDLTYGSGSDYPKLQVQFVYNNYTVDSGN